MIKLGYSYADWKLSVTTPILWNPDKTPHLLIAGTTGGGKTVMAQLAVKQTMTGH